MRPCPACGHRSDPTVSKHCPECGEAQLSAGWSVLLREASPWFWRVGHAGSLIYLTVFGLWLLALMTGEKAPSLGALTYLAMVCFPISIAHLRGKRLDDVWIITDTRLEHRQRVGPTSFMAAEDGWEFTSITPPKRGHLWRIRLSRMVKGKRKSFADMMVDDRNDAPAEVEARVRRVLTSASASGT